MAAFLSGVAPHWEFVARLVIAALLGSLVGIERERLTWAAGLRTHMLVSVGACLFMIVSAYGFSGSLGQNVVLDPSRVAAQVASGIGFLGAGTILLRDEIVRGLTTAAGIWAVAAIGLAVGGGLYVEAAAATAIILAILTGMKPVEEWLQHRNRSHEFRLTAERRSVSAEAVATALGYRANRISRFVCAPAADETFDEIEISLRRMPEDEAREVARLLAALPHVRRVAGP